MNHSKEPQGTYLLGLLIELLAEQEGVNITYELEKGVRNNE